MKTQHPKVLFWDRHILALQKPVGMLVADEHSGKPTLLSHARAIYSETLVASQKGYCVPVHFLDQPVSGVVLFALSSKCAARLQKLFSSRQMEKTYIALVTGCPPDPTGILTDHLIKDREKNKSVVIPAHLSRDEDTKECQLSYQLMKRFQKTSLLKIQPKTGRSHQIRVQLANRGFPIVGDVKYGGPRLPKGENNGIALHALSLEFAHPVGGSTCRIVSEIPTWGSNPQKTKLP